MKRTLYGYWRSSASYRLRIAMELKMLSAEQRSVHLVQDGGQQHRPEYRALNPQSLVPTLVLGEEGSETALIQSLAILEYLEEAYPDPPLLPVDPFERARVRGIAQLIACELHPLNNLRVLQYLSTELGADEEAKLRWYRHWIAEGFSALEQIFEQPATGQFCHGDQPTFADVCLIPQVYNAKRFGCDLTPYPRLLRIEANALELSAFRSAQPELQVDAPKS